MAAAERQGSAGGQEEGTFEEALHRLAAQAAELCGADIAFLDLIGPDVPSQAVHAVGEAPAGALRIAQRVLGDLAAAAGRPVRVDDCRHDPRLGPAGASGEGASLLAVPLGAPGGGVGILCVGRRPPRPFTEGDAAALERLACHAAAWIELARRADAAEGARAQLAALVEIQAELRGGLALDPLLQLTVDRAAALIGARGAIYLPEGDRLVSRVDSEHAPFSAPVAFGEGITGRVAATRQGLRVNDYPAWAPAVPAYVANRVQHVISQPLLVGDTLLGVMTLARYEPDAAPFGEGDLAALGGFAAQAALALRSASLYDEALRRRAVAEELATLARGLTQRQPLETLCQRIAEGACALLGADVVRLRLREPDGSLRLVGTQAGGVAPVRLPAGTPAVRFMETMKRPVVVEDALVEAGLGPRVVAARRHICRDVGARAWVAVPLRAASEIVGGLVIGNVMPRRFTAEDVALVEALADQAAVAIRSAALDEEAQAGRRQAELLAEAARALNASLSPDAVLSSLATAARALAGGDRADIALWEPGRATMRIRRHAGRDLGGSASIPIEPGRGARGWVLEQRRPFRIGDFERDPRTAEPYREIARAAGTVSFLAVPVVIDGRVEAVLSVTSAAADAFGDREEAGLLALAEQAGIALRNAELYGEAVRRRRESEGMSRILGALTGELELKAVLQTLLQATRELTGAAARIALWEPGRRAMRVRLVAGEPVPLDEVDIVPGKGARGWVLDHGRPFRTGDYASDPRPGPAYRDAARTERLVSFLAVPVRVGSEVEALLMVGSSERDAFGERDEELLVRLADHAGLALRSSGLYEEARQRQGEAETLARAARALNESRDVSAIAARISAIAREVVGCVAAGVFEADLEHGRLVVLGSTGGDADRLAPGTALALPPGDLTEDALRHGAARWSADVFADPRYPPPAADADRWARLGVRAQLSVPLRTVTRTIGVLDCVDRGGRQFMPGEVALIEALADDAALALERSRLYEDTARRQREAEALAEVTRAISASLDEEAILRAIAGAALQVTGAVDATVALWTAARDVMRVRHRAPVARPLDLDAVPVEPGRGARGRVLVEGRPFRTDDYQRDPRVGTEYLEVMRGAGFRSALVVPVMREGRVEALLGVSHPEVGRFGEREEAALVRLAEHCAIALGNAQLYREAERRRRQAEAVAEVARTINASLDLDTVLQRVAEGARQGCGGDMARIALWDPAENAMAFRYWVNARSGAYGTVRLRRGEGVGGQVMVSGRPFRTGDWAADPRITKETHAVVEAEGIVAMLAVPIMIDGRVEGLLYTETRTRRPFTDADEAVATQLAEQAAIAIKNARLFAAVEGAGRRLHALSTRLLEVQEAERRHLARELHDEVGQTLTALKINLQILGRRPAEGAPAGRLDESIRMVDRILQGVRRMSLELRPSLLDDLGLPAALRWYVKAQAERAGIEATLEVDDVEGEIPGAVATTCYRIVQEALTNVIRHANARRVAVRLSREGEELALRVQDDGVGFDVVAGRRRASEGGSMGLLGLQERAELAAGRTAIESAPGGGTAVRAWFPLPARAQPA